MKRIFLILLIILFNLARAETPLVITEIMYDPEGRDQDREWIEVFNPSNQTFFLKAGKDGWRLNDGTNHLFKEAITLAPHEVFIIVQNKSEFLNDYHDIKTKIVPANFSLKNSSGRIQIFDEKKNLLAERVYQNLCGGAGNGYSLIFVANLCYENKLGKGTPGTYPEPEKIFFEAQPQVNKEITTTTQTGDISTSSFDFQAKTSTTETKIAEVEEESPTIYISEFLPNPTGNDKNQEFVELYNFGNETISLSNFSLGINDKQSLLTGSIAPGEYFVIKNKTNIRNNGENLALFWRGEKIFEISYQGKAPESLSFARNNNGKWEFTQPTPGQENVFGQLSSKSNLALISQPELSSVEQQNFNLKNANSQVKIPNNQNYFLSLLGVLIIIIVLTIVVWLKL